MKKYLLILLMAAQIFALKAKFEAGIAVGSQFFVGCDSLFVNDTRTDSNGIVHEVSVTRTASFILATYPFEVPGFKYIILEICDSIMKPDTSMWWDPGPWGIFYRHRIKMYIPVLGPGSPIVNYTFDLNIDTLHFTRHPLIDSVWVTYDSSDTMLFTNFACTDGSSSFNKQGFPDNTSLNTLDTAYHAIIKDGKVLPGMGVDTITRPYVVPVVPPDTVVVPLDTIVPPDTVIPPDTTGETSVIPRRRVIITNRSLPQEKELFNALGQKMIYNKKRFQIVLKKAP